MLHFLFCSITHCTSRVGQNYSPLYQIVCGCQLLTKDSPSQNKLEQVLMAWLLFRKDTRNRFDFPLRILTYIHSRILKYTCVSPLVHINLSFPFLFIETFSRLFNICLTKFSSHEDHTLLYLICHFHSSKLHLPRS